VFPTGFTGLSNAPLTSGSNRGRGSTREIRSPVLLTEHLVSAAAILPTSTLASATQTPADRNTVLRLLALFLSHHHSLQLQALSADCREKATVAFLENTEQMASDKTKLQMEQIHESYSPSYLLNITQLRMMRWAMYVAKLEDKTNRC
jgi:hypothetical protein